jgi:non-heme chloroperoxidase
MNTVTAEDGNYKAWGEGPAVTMSHGWPLNADAWDRQMMFLGEHGFRCIAHDRRGHGVLDQFWTWSMQSGLKNSYECVKSLGESDSTKLAGILKNVKDIYYQS